MVSVLVATHGELAKELFNAMDMLTGVAEKMDYVCLKPGDNVEDFYNEAEEKINNLGYEDGILALVDIIGGSPNNTMFKLKQKYNMRIITGVNLPMLLSLSMDRTNEDTLDELVKLIIENGKDSIKEFGEIK
ncbi:MAG: PTS sugar transporter subunit IIA [Eubacteriales bacterium]|nr:PTS sugar transporter subunit IIA [Eubacteriales bacterium]